MQRPPTRPPGPHKGQQPRKQWQAATGKRSAPKGLTGWPPRQSCHYTQQEHAHGGTPDLKPSSGASSTHTHAEVLPGRF